MNRKYAYLTSVENKKRRGNADKTYTAFVTEDFHVYFFTDEELRRANVRALQNRDDIELVDVSYEIVEK
jgi:hypothetical protein